jgi:acyl-CoA synthetase (AMP-forming)/AMP-acid ligase II
MMGEKVGAAIVLKPGARAAADEILDYAKEHLADFKVPQFLVLRSESLPRNPGGKILKKTLRESLDWGKQLW